MKKVFFMMAAMALVCTGCAKQAAQQNTETTEVEEVVEAVMEETVVEEAPVVEETQVEAPKALDLTGEWTIIRIKELPIVTPEDVEAPKMSFADGNCHLSFCNQINAAYELNGNEITFGAVASTKMMGKPEVMAMEKAIVALLNGTVTATVDGNTMCFAGKDGAPVMMLTK